MGMLSSSPWSARIMLACSYAAWLGIMVLLGSLESRWAGIACGVLLVLIWLPFDVYRKRNELQEWLPIHLVVVLGASLTMLLLNDDVKEDRSFWWTFCEYYLLRGFLALVFLRLTWQVEKRMERRAKIKWDAFLEDRRRAPHGRPELRFAGKPPTTEREIGTL